MMTNPLSRWLPVVVFGILLTVLPPRAAGTPQTNEVPRCIHVAPLDVNLQPAPASFWGVARTRAEISARVLSACDEPWTVRLRITGIDPTNPRPVYQKVIAVRVVPHDATTAVKSVLLATEKVRRVQTWTVVVMKCKKLPGKVRKTPPGNPRSL